MRDLRDNFADTPGGDSQPRCPVHGFVMCEQFDYLRINTRAELAIPNGRYVCYACEDAKREDAQVGALTKKKEQP